jgi:hypothetical protein
MEEKYLHDKLALLYKDYNDVIKPLIAVLELYYEKFPLPVFNEIRAYNDHIARCYTIPLEKNTIDKETAKAKSHTERIILDCYKYLSVELHKRTIVKFEKLTNNVDITNINNGNFREEYYKRRKSIITQQKLAKSEEQVNKENAIRLYGNVFNEYCKLEDFLEENVSGIHWSRAKFTTKRIFKCITFVSSAILSGVVSLFVPASASFIENVKAYIMTLFGFN